MADKITKLLAKLSARELKQVREIIHRIISSDISGLDVKKLKGQTNIFRVRRGNLRIIFQKRGDAEPEILQISRRNEKTYRNY